jgi:hypothetical protein
LLSCTARTEIVMSTFVERKRASVE